MVSYLQRLGGRYVRFRLNLKLNRLLHMQRELMADLTALTVAVQDNTNAVVAVKAAFEALSGSGDQAAIDALTQKIAENNVVMAELIAPVAPPAA